MSTATLEEGPKPEPELEAPAPGEAPGDRVLHKERQLPQHLVDTLEENLKAYNAWLDSDLDFLRWLDERRDETLERLAKMSKELDETLRAVAVLRKEMGK